MITSFITEAAGIITLLVAILGFIFAAFRQISATRENSKELVKLTERLDRFTESHFQLDRRISILEDRMNRQ